MLSLLIAIALMFMPIKVKVERVFPPPQEQVTRVMPWGTVVVTLQCDDSPEIKRFVDCMHGPPYFCRPLALADGTVLGWLNAGRADESHLRTYICMANLASCWKFDRDYDGDIDLQDWALYTAGDWGTRKSIIATPRRKR